MKQPVPLELRLTRNAEASALQSLKNGKKRATRRFFDHRGRKLLRAIQYSNSVDPIGFLTQLRNLRFSQGDIRRLMLCEDPEDLAEKILARRKKRDNQPSFQWLNSVQQQIHQRRLTVRLMNLAVAFLRGLPYSQIEERVHDTNDLRKRKDFEESIVNRLVGFTGSTPVDLKAWFNT